jgi:hypothetical protein
MKEGWIEMIRKSYVVGLALVAVFAFSSVMVASASAETTLLAEWLLNGAAVTGTTAVETAGEVKVEDNKVPIIGKVAIDCSFIADGWVDANGLDFISELLTLGKVKVTAKLVGTGMLCSSATGCEAASEGSPIEVWPATEGWETLLVLMENGTFLDIIHGSGYEVLCLILGAMVEDECNATEAGILEQNGTAPNGAEIPAHSIGEPLATCKEGGAASGVNETLTVAKTIPTGGGELTVSSEGTGR